MAVERVGASAASLPQAGSLCRSLKRGGSRQFTANAQRHLQWRDRRQAQRGAPRLAAGGGAAVEASPPAPKQRGAERSHETDVVVIGSGIGGLSCAALLAKYGLRVTVCESHVHPGGAAHAWEKGGYHFESGPSLYSGMAARGPGANPLAHVLQAIGEELDLIKYNGWNVMLPEGEFWMEVGANQFSEVLGKLRGPAAVAEWQRLQEAMRPLATAVTALPAAAFRGDPGAALTAGLRYLPKLLTTGPDALRLTGPFSQILDSVVTDAFIKRWMDLLCFLLSGLPANGTVAAEVAFMFNEWYRPDCCLEFPRGGSAAMVDALVRGIEKHGGQVLTAAHVEEIVLSPSGRASGVRLRGGGEITARKAVVSNSFGDATLRLLPAAAVPPEYRRKVDDTPLCPSFMHLHVGFDATGMDAPALHHIIVNDWERGVGAEQNVVLVSIPSVIDPGMAPPGHHCLHAYLPATEPWERWAGLKRGSPEYEKLKEERSQVLWKGVERIVPDIRQRAKVQLVGTPLTHAAFLRRQNGSYGPAVRAGTDPALPGPATPIPGLYAVGDGTFPGIGLPAVAGSGMVAANTLAGVGQHWRLLDELGC